jgi:hypothetical protein
MKRSLARYVARSSNHRSLKDDTWTKYMVLTPKYLVLMMDVARPSRTYDFKKDR